MNVADLSKPMKELLSYVDMAKYMGTLDKATALEVLELGRQVVLRQMDVILAPKDKWTNHELLTCYDWIFIGSAMLGGAERCFFEENKFCIPQMLLEKKVQDAIKHTRIVDAVCPTCRREIAPSNNCMPCRYCDRCFTGFGEDGGEDGTTWMIRCPEGIHLTKLGKGAAGGVCQYCRYTKSTMPNVANPLQHHFEENKFVPTHPELHKKLLVPAMEETPADPNHFGHLIWQFSHLVDRLNEVLVGTGKRRRYKY
ncbi:hypothetical protein ACA910_012111 [Epithemia clementina (nom. ined.)]